MGLRSSRLLVLPLLALLAASLAPGTLRAQGVDAIKATYTKYEFRIPMRDGVRLFTAVYVPKDDSRTYPILLTRTPYSVAPYGLDQVRETLGPSPAFGQSGYIFAYQDVRGRMMSEGDFINMRPHHSAKSQPSDVDESSDTYDTIAWLLQNIPGHNDRVGQWGISYPGFYTAAGMINAHPALVAVSPQAPVMDWFAGDDFHHNGALFLPHAFNFLVRFGLPRPEPTTKPADPFDHGTPDGYDFFLKMGALPNADRLYLKGKVAFWNEMMAHPNYDDFWKARNLRPHLKAIQPAVLTVGGWFDAENLFGALECYHAVENNQPKRSNQLVMGPWSHGQWARDDGDSLGDVRFDQKTADFYRAHIEFPFFEHYLKDNPDPQLPEAYVFETGRNQWRKHDQWPPAQVATQPLFLRENGRLALNAPPTTAIDPPYDEFPADPLRPVPVTAEIAIGMTIEYMVADQRFAARRPDVLVYQTEPLEADLTLAGPIHANLTVATSGTDADWVVKIIDVYPGSAADPTPNPRNVKMGGYQQLVRAEIMRGKFRDALDQPRPFTPDEPTSVAFRLNDVYHTFRTGHRLMVQIQSSWFPLVDRNPQRFMDINSAQDQDFRKSLHKVFRSPTQPSRLLLPILPANPGPAVAHSS